MPSMWVSTTSPALRKRGGLRAPPMPAGVPVKITSPGSSGRIAESSAIRRGTLKTMLLVRLLLHASRR